MAFDFSNITDEELEAMAAQSAPASEPMPQKPLSEWTDEELEAYASEPTPAPVQSAAHSPRMTREERIAANNRAIETARSQENPGFLSVAGDALAEGAKGAARAVKSIGSGIVGMASGAVRLAGTPVRLATGWEGLHRLADTIDSSYENFGADALMSEYGENPDGWGYALGRAGEKVAGVAGSLAALGGVGKAVGAAGTALKAAGHAKTAAAVANTLPLMFGNDAAVRAYDTARANGKSKGESAALAALNGAIHFFGFKAFENQSLKKMLNIGPEVEVMMPKWADALAEEGGQSFSSLVRGTRNGMVKYIAAENGKRALKAGGIMGLQDMLSDPVMQVAEGASIDDIDFSRMLKAGAHGVGEGALMEGLTGGAAIFRSQKAAEKFMADKYFRGKDYKVMGADGKMHDEPGLLNTSEGRMVLMKQNPDATERVLDIVEHGGTPRPAELDAAFLPPDMTAEELKKFASDWRNDLKPYVDEAWAADARVVEQPAVWPNGWDNAGEEIKGYVVPNDGDVAPGREVAIAHRSGGSINAPQKIKGVVESVDGDKVKVYYRDGMGYGQHDTFKKSELVGVMPLTAVPTEGATSQTAQNRIEATQEGAGAQGGAAAGEGTEAASRAFGEKGAGAQPPSVPAAPAKSNRLRRADGTDPLAEKNPAPKTMRKAVDKISLAISNRTGTGAITPEEADGIVRGIVESPETKHNRYRDFFNPLENDAKWHESLGLDAESAKNIRDAVARASEASQRKSKQVKLDNAVKKAEAGDKDAPTPFGLVRIASDALDKARVKGDKAAVTRAQKALEDANAKFLAEYDQVPEADKERWYKEQEKQFEEWSKKHDNVARNESVTVDAPIPGKDDFSTTMAEQLPAKSADASSGDDRGGFKLVPWENGELVRGGRVKLEMRLKSPTTGKMLSRTEEMSRTELAKKLGKTRAADLLGGHERLASVSAPESPAARDLRFASDENYQKWLKSRKANDAEPLRERYEQEQAKAAKSIARNALPGVDVEVVDRAFNPETDGSVGKRKSIGRVFTGSTADYANRSRQGGVDDGPSLHKIGTGEGTANEAWGLYFTNAPGIAGRYANQFVYELPKQLLRKGTLVPKNPSYGGDGKDVYERFRRKGYSNDEIIEILKNNYEAHKEGRLDRFESEPSVFEKNDLEALDFANKHGNEYEVKDDPRQKHAYVYEQTIFTDRDAADNSHILDWNKKVDDTTVKMISDKLGQNLEGGDGQHIYNQVSSILGGKKEASIFLRDKCDIDGVRYQSPASEGPGHEFTTNYISFRDDNIRVDHKWKDGRMRYLRDGEGRVVGTFDRSTNKVTLYRGASAATLVHELGGHATLRFAEQEAERGNRQLLDRINRAIDEAPQALKDEIRSRYPGVDETALRDEIWAALRERNSPAMEKAIKTLQGKAWYNRAWSAFRDAWKGLLARMGFNRADLSQIDKMSNDEFLSHLDRLMSDGKTLGRLEAMDEGTRNAVRNGVSAADDAAYMDAVERGDTETAQRMVREAASRNYDTARPVFHAGTLGTENAVGRKTYVFSDNPEGFHVGTLRAATERFSDVISLRGEFDFTAIRTKNGRYRGAWQVGDEIGATTKETFASKADAQFAANMMLHEALQNPESAKRVIGTGGMMRLHELYLRNGLNLKKMSDVIARKKGSWEEDVAEAKAEGYDGIEYENSGEDKGSTSYIVWNKSDVKSADPVTRDDAGNVIPLSQRFNPKSDDIREARSPRPAGSRIMDDQQTKGEKFTEKFIDSLAPVKSVQDELGGVKEITRADGYTDHMKSTDLVAAKDKANGRLEYEVRQHQFRVDDINRDLSRAALPKQSTEDLVDDFNLYLQCKHAPERNLSVAQDRGDAYTPDYSEGMGQITLPGGNRIGLSENVADRLLKGMRGKYGLKFKMFENAADKVYKMLEADLDRRFDAGRLSAEDYAFYKTRWHGPGGAPGKWVHYVPLKTDMERLEPEALNSSTAGMKRNEFMKAQGRGTGDIADSPLAAAVLQTEQGIRGSIKNEVANVEANLVEHAKKQGIPIAEIVPGDEIRRGRTYSFTFADGETVDASGSMRLVENHPEIHLFKRDGKLYAIRYDKGANGRGLAFARAASGENMGRWGQGTEWIPRMTHWMSAMRTQYSPEFTVSNWLADHLEAAQALVGRYGLKEGGKAFAKTIASEIQNWKDLRAYLKDGTANGYIKEFVEGGGLTKGGVASEGFDSETQKIRSKIEQFRRKQKQWREMSLANLAKSLGRNVTDFLSFANELAEYSTRTGLYTALRKQGVPKAEAIKFARDATVNFNRKGTAMPYINGLYMFANASVQGAVRSVQAMRDTHGKELIAALTAIGVAKAVIDNYLGNDDEREAAGGRNARNQSEYDKKHNVGVPIGGGRQIVPLRFRGPYAAVPYLAQTAANVAMGATSPEDGAKTLFRELGDQVTDLVGGNGIMNDKGELDGALIGQSIAPSVADPIVQLATGKDYKGDERRQKSFDKTMPASSNGKRNTASGYKWLAKGVNAIPFLSGGNEFRKGRLDFAPEDYQLVLEFLGGAPMRDINNVASSVNNAIQLASGGTPERTLSQIPFVRRVVREYPESTSRYYDALEEYERDKAEFKKTTPERRKEMKADKPYLFVGKSLLDGQIEQVKKYMHLERGEVKVGQKWVEPKTPRTEAQKEEWRKKRLALQAQILERLGK